MRTGEGTHRSDITAIQNPNARGLTPNIQPRRTPGGGCARRSRTFNLGVRQEVKVQSLHGCLTLSLGVRQEAKAASYPFGLASAYARKPDATLTLNLGVRQEVGVGIPFLPTSAYARRWEDLVGMWFDTHTYRLPASAYARRRGDVFNSTSAYARR
jgi:hypothetical protein